MSAVTPRRSAMRPIAANTSAMATSRVASSPARMSIENSHVPGMTLMAPCGTASWPTVPTRVARRAAALLDGENDLGGGGRRIVPQRHRHRAGMAGHATDRDPKACRSGNRGDDPERQAALQQHRPLLDVNFEITAQRFRPARQRADRRQDRCPRFAGRVAKLTPSASPRCKIAASKRPAMAALPR